MDRYATPGLEESSATPEGETTTGSAGAVGRGLEGAGPARHLRRLLEVLLHGAADRGHLGVRVELGTLREPPHPEGEAHHPHQRDATGHAQHAAPAPRVLQEVALLGEQAPLGHGRLHLGRRGRRHGDVRAIRLGRRWLLGHMAPHQGRRQPRPRHRAFDGGTRARDTVPSGGGRVHADPRRLDLRGVHQVIRITGGVGSGLGAGVVLHHAQAGVLADAGDLLDIPGSGPARQHGRPARLGRCGPRRRHPRLLVVARRAARPGWVSATCASHDPEWVTSAPSFGPT